MAVNITTYFAPFFSVAKVETEINFQQLAQYYHYSQDNQHFGDMVDRNPCKSFIRINSLVGGE